MSTNGIANAQTATATDTLPTVTTDGFGAASAPQQRSAPEQPSTPEQLSLLATSCVPSQFRLDERTRRSGLAHVAALRAQIAAQAAARSLSPLGKRSAGRPESGRQSSDRQNRGRQIAA